jgi:hypothetical protein
VAKLIYSAITSLDGYTVDADGHFDWSAPDDQVHAFINDLERPVGTLPLRAADVRRHEGRRHARGAESAAGRG